MGLELAPLTLQSVPLATCSSLRQLIIVKLFILLIIITINMTFIIYICIFFCHVCVRNACLRRNGYQSTLLHLLSFMFDFMIEFLKNKIIIILYLSCPHHEHKFPTV